MCISRTLKKDPWVYLYKKRVSYISVCSTKISANICTSKCQYNCIIIYVDLPIFGMQFCFLNAVLFNSTSVIGMRISFPSRLLTQTPPSCSVAPFSTCGPAPAFSDSKIN